MTVMSLTNHLLTGVILGASLPLPLALPLAFISHFVLDALLHFGFRNDAEHTRYRSLHLAIIIIDVFLSSLLIGWLFVIQRYDLLPYAFVAWSPDIVWVYRFIFVEKFGKIPPSASHEHPFIDFHIRIQRFERVWGIAVEAFYALFLLMGIGYLL